MALASGNNEELLRGVLLDYARGLSIGPARQDEVAPLPEPAVLTAEAGVPVMAVQAELTSVGASAVMGAGG